MGLFLLGILVGGIAGFLCMAVCSASKYYYSRLEDCVHSYEQGYEHGYNDGCGSICCDRKEK